MLDHLRRVALMRSGENYDFEVWSQRLKELDSAWTDVDTSLDVLSWRNLNVEDDV